MCNCAGSLEGTLQLSSIEPTNACCSPLPAPAMGDPRAADPSCRARRQMMRQPCCLARRMLVFDDTQPVTSTRREDCTQTPQPKIITPRQTPLPIYCAGDLKGVALARRRIDLSPGPVCPPKSPSPGAGRTVTVDSTPQFLCPPEEPEEVDAECTGDQVCPRRSKVDQAVSSPDLEKEDLSVLSHDSASLFGEKDTATEEETDKDAAPEEVLQEPAEQPRPSCPPTPPPAPVNECPGKKDPSLECTCPPCRC